MKPCSLFKCMTLDHRDWVKGYMVIENVSDPVLLVNKTLPEMIGNYFPYCCVYPLQRLAGEERPVIVCRSS